MSIPNMVSGDLLETSFISHESYFCVAGNIMALLSTGFFTSLDPALDRGSQTEPEVHYTERSRPYESGHSALEQLYRSPRD